MEPVSDATIARLRKSGLWMVRNSNNGVSPSDDAMGFRWSPVGKWTEAEDWNPLPVCGGGLHGQGPGGFGGFSTSGTRFDFCETGSERVVVDENQIKVRRARIIATDADALRVLTVVCDDVFPGYLYLSRATLRKGVTLPQTVGGYLYLSRATLRKGVTLPQTVGGDLYLSGATISEGVTLPQTVGGNLYLSRATLRKGVTLPQTVGGHIDLSGATISEGVTLPQVNGRIYR